MAPSILLLDRDENTRGILRAYFEHHGHRILDTADSDEALRLAGEHRPALLVGDIPREPGGRSGFVERLRAEVGSRAPVLILTARATEEEVAAARAVGQAVLTKPAKPAEVLREAERLLGGVPGPSPEGARVGRPAGGRGLDAGDPR